MRDYTYNFEIEDIIVQFIDAYNDVVIKRYNNDRSIEDQIHVNFVYSPKHRAIYDILNKNPNPVSLPVIAVYITGLSRDNDRVENKMAKSYFYTDDRKDVKERREPVPIKLEMGMSVIAKSTTDMLQILSNWMPYTNPYIYIDVADPSTGQTIRTKVRWNENITINSEIDDPKATFRTGFDTGFTIETFLFKKPLPDSGIICKTTTNMSVVTSMNNCFMDLAAFEASVGVLSANKNTFVIEGIALMTCMDPFIVSLEKDDYRFNISGKNLDFTSNLYVSGEPGMFPTSAYNWYNFFPSVSTITITEGCSDNPTTSTNVVSSNCPGFSAIPISAFEIDAIGADMSFVLPYNPLTNGVFSVIATTSCGCSKITMDSVNETVTPYPTGGQGFTNYIS